MCFCCCFFLFFLLYCRFSEILNKLNGCFSDTPSFRISVISSSQWIMFLVGIFWVIWQKMMQTCEALDFWGLHKNTNSEFPCIRTRLPRSAKRYFSFQPSPDIYTPDHRKINLGWWKIPYRKTRRTEFAFYHVI